MINQVNEISDIIKEDVNKIYQLFLDNSYSRHIHKFGNDKIGFRELIIKFNHINNYYSNIQIDKSNLITVNIGIPTNGKEKRIKKNITHELTHIIEIIGLNNKDYTKYNKIKLDLIEFKNQPISKSMESIIDIFYKTLDNEINVNVTQTYIYVKSDGICSKIEALNRLNEWETYILYNSIKNIRLDILENGLSKDEVTLFNSILIKNKVNTISSDEISNWIKHWFKIFNTKAEIFLNNSKKIIKEIEEHWKEFETYTTYIPGYPKNIDYSEYIKNL